jgi:hypothetical protein
LKPDRGAVDTKPDRGSDRGAGLANRETARGDRGGRDSGDLEAGRRGDNDRGPGTDRPGRNSDLASTDRGGDGWRDGRDGRGDWDGGGRGDWDRDGDGRHNNGGWNGRHHHHHNDWHHGFWGLGLWGFSPWWGGWGWGGGWGGWGLGYGLSFGYGSWWDGGWGWNSWGYSPLCYSSGYYGYYNPYYTEPLVLGSTVIDYSQPIAVAQAPTQVSDVGDDAPSPTMAEFDAARASFYSGDYQAALAGVDRALQQTPDDAVLHEFRALALFAQGDYQQAAATVSSVLAAGPGWNWDTLRGLYPDVTTYTRQLRALEGYARGHASAADARFLLAYHYLTCGHTDAAVEQLKRVTALQPSDTVARQLLKSMSPESQAPVPAPAPASDPTLPPRVPTAGPVAGNDPTLPPAPPGAGG